MGHSSSHRTLGQDVLIQPGPWGHCQLEHSKPLNLVSQDDLGTRSAFTWPSDSKIRYLVRYLVPRGPTRTVAIMRWCPALPDLREGTDTFLLHGIGMIIRLLARLGEHQR